MRRHCLIKSAMEGMIDGKRSGGRKRFQLVDNIKIKDIILQKYVEDKDGCRK